MKSVHAPRLHQGLILLAIFLLIVFIFPETLFNFWDFRNNLWGPAHLLVSGQSPYALKQLFPDSNAVWMPMLIGLLFPIGWLNFSLASRIWFAAGLFTLGGVVYLSYRPARMTPLKLAGVLVLIFFFPPSIQHLQLGQVSFLIVLLLLLPVLLPGSTWTTSLACALALTKPQLCILVLPGLLLYMSLKKGFSEAARFTGLLLAWSALLTLPFWLAYPNWVPDFIAALRGNQAWAQPSLLFALNQQIGPKSGAILWVVAAIAVFLVNLWLWSRIPANQAVSWSLALTCLVSPYIWSWDFVLLLPLFLQLLGRFRKPLPLLILLGGFIGSSFWIWRTRWNAQVPDHILAWVPVVLVSIFLVSMLAGRRSGAS